MRQAACDSADSDSESPSNSDSSTSFSDSLADSSEDIWADIFGPNWRGHTLSDSCSALRSLFDSVSDTLTSVPGFLLQDDAGDRSSSGSGFSGVSLERRQWSQGSGSEGSDIDMLADDEMDSSDGEDLDIGGGYTGRWCRLQRWVVGQIQEMYSQRYEKPRNELPRGPSYLHHVLHVLKNSRPDHFREELRVTPCTFDAMVAAIELNPIFANNSTNGQMAVEEQLAITLYRFGHDGNSASLQSVANWAGVGKGTVLLVTRRVMAAVLHPEFMSAAVQMPTEEEKEQAKEWVHKHSCKSWRDGWCLVDGTLVPLSERPRWFGESYFDRKNRYSLNFQVSISLPGCDVMLILSRLSHFPTCRSSTLDLDTPEQFTTLPHGREPDLPRNMTPF